VARETSVETYNAIKNNGLLSEKRLQVYETLYELGPLTASEIADAIPDFKSPSVGFNVHARLCELREMGGIKEVGKKTCTISNRKVILWDVTPNVPVPFVGTLSNKEKISIFRAACEEALQALKTHGLAEIAQKIENNLPAVED